MYKTIVYLYCFIYFLPPMCSGSLNICVNIYVAHRCTMFRHDLRKQCWNNFDINIIILKSSMCPNNLFYYLKNNWLQFFAIL